LATIILATLKQKKMALIQCVYLKQSAPERGQTIKRRK
jgi:hypothetical protein